MKKISFLSALVLALLFSANVFAQKAVTKVSSVKQKGSEINFNLVSSKKFIFGSNRYELHIGDKEFVRNTQSEKAGKGYMTFLLSSEEFSALKDDADIYLTYGHVKSTQDMNQIAKQSPRCWSLGKFNRSLLTK